MGIPAAAQAKALRRTLALPVHPFPGAAMTPAHARSRTIASRSASTCCLTLALASTACRTSLDESNWAASMHHAPIGEGVTRPFAADLDMMLQAAQRALSAAGFDQVQNCPGPTADDPRPPCIGPQVTRVDDHTAYIYGTKPAGMAGHRYWSGEHVRIVVEQTGPNRSTVRVISKLRGETIIGRKGDYSGIILSAMSRDLPQGQSTKGLADPQATRE